MHFIAADVVLGVEEWHKKIFLAYPSNLDETFLS